jgi:hypothetical protein
MMNENLKDNSLKSKLNENRHESSLGGPLLMFLIFIPNRNSNMIADSVNNAS